MSPSDVDRAELRDTLAQLILRHDLTLTSSEVTDQGGVEHARGLRLWRALGFPETGDALAYGEPDVKALAAVAVALDGQMLDESTVLRMTRGLGATMARLADWQVSALVDQIEHDVESGKSPTRLEAAAELARSAAPGFEHLMVYAWRRHLAAAAARVEALGAADAELLSTTMTVGLPICRASRRCRTASTTAASARWSRTSRRAAPTSSRRTAGASSRRSATPCCS